MHDPVSTATPSAARSAFEGDRDTVLVAGVMRSGQTWLCFMLAHALNARFLEPYCLLRGIVYSGHDYVRGLSNGHLPNRSDTSYRLIVKTHERPDPHFSLTRKVILIVRDPRDMATSAALRYHVMATTGSDVEEDAQGLALIPSPIAKPPTLKERVWRLVYGNRFLALLHTMRKWRAFHAGWNQVPFRHVVRFEDLVQRPVETMEEICRYLEVDVSRAQLQETAHLLSMSEIKKHETAGAPGKNIGFRKGVVGDFKNHLSRLELWLIKRYSRDLAAEYGYTL